MEEGKNVDCEAAAAANIKYSARVPGDPIGFKQEREKRAEWAAQACVAHSAHSAHFSISCLKPNNVSPGSPIVGMIPVESECRAGYDDTSWLCSPKSFW